MPVFNGERYLLEAAESILGQTYRDFELIISDNCSTDRTRDICESLAARDSRVRYYRNEQNLGAAPNYNRVFALSSGEYFKWADYDDVIAPSFLDECVDVLDRDPDAVCCCPKVRFIDENGSAIGDYDPAPDSSSPRPSVRFGNWILSHDHRLAQASGLMRAEHIRRTVMHGSYPCSDEVFMANMALLGRFAVVDERLLHIRLHAAQSFRGALGSERARVAFFDSSLSGRVVPVKWQYLRMCLVAIGTAGIGRGERLACYWHMLRWLCRRQNLRSVAKDALLMVDSRVSVFPGLRRQALAASEQGRDYR